MYTFTKKMIRSLLAFVIAIGGLALASSRASAAPVTINLCAVAGNATLTGAVTVPIWGFALNPADCNTAIPSLPGPVLDVNVGDVVTINLTTAINLGSHAASFELAGLPVTPLGGGQYQFTASRAGTFVYQSPGDAGRQMAMGLYGALIVRSATANHAYDDPISDPNRSLYDVEATLVLSQVDPNFNAAPDTFNMNNYLATYWLINGKAYPDTAPGITAIAGQRLLLRYVNAGYDNTSMMLLGMHEQVLARDAYPLNNPFFANTETLPAGGTEDAIATMPSFAAPTSNGFPLFNRNLHVTNGTPSVDPGGMLIFIHP